MFRRIWMVAILVALAANCVWAQQTPRQSKCDWEEINFEFNSNQVIDGSPSLMRLAELLSKHPGYKALVEGNTDNLGSGTYNQKLGQGRADSVADFLAGKGANRGQITATSRGKTNPEATGYKNRYSQTDEARWMNRRVVITVTDERGAVVSDACSAEPPPPPAPAPGPSVADCCSDLRRELGDLTSLLRQLLQKQQALQDEIDKLEKGATAQAKNIQDKIDALPKPLNESQVGNVVDTRLEHFRDPRFSLLGINIGADDHRDITFSGRGRFFAPFKDHFAVQAQGEYLYFRNQREAQFDLGLVDRMGPFQASLFGSFKHVSLRDPSFGRGSGNLGQAALMLDYIFKLGRVGIFGTKAFLDGDVISRRNASFVSGFNSDGTQVFSIAPNIFQETYLKVVDQVGVSATIGFIGPSYIEGNVGYLRSYAHADRPGGSLRFVVPVSKRLAFTVEGDMNPTLLGRGNGGRAMVGLQFGNFEKPREFAASKYPVPVDVPRIRYEVLTRSVHVGASPPIADAGPDQIGVPAGNITLNGSNSRDPNGEALTFRWVQETGPPVALSGATQAIANFTAVAGQAYGFRLTVTNTDGLSASARVRVSAREDAKVQILFFNANPLSIQVGQAATLSYRILNADSADITPGIGAVNPTNGQISVSPTDTTTYKLHAKNAVSEENATVTVTVTKPQPQVLFCTATPMNIAQGEAATILYDTLGATSVNITPGIGAVGNKGSITVTPAATTNYTVTASNSFGSASCSVTISVTPGTAPRIIRFTAGPMTIQQGGTSTLVWQVENAKNVTIAPIVGSVGLVGTQDVTLSQTTQFTLTATNDFGQAQAQVTVTVTPPPPPPVIPSAVITSFTANPPVSPSPGSAVTLTCLATNATSVTINGVGPVDANNSVKVNPLVDTTYTCTAVGKDNKPATATLLVPVTQPPPPPPPPPVVVIVSSNGTCTANSPTSVICETVVREVTLDLSGSTSPAGNNPLSFFTTSRQTSAVVLNPTSSKPLVELSELFGDYFFDVAVTDSKGNKSTVTVDVRLVVTRR